MNEQIWIFRNFILLLLAGFTLTEKVHMETIFLSDTTDQNGNQSVPDELHHNQGHPLVSRSSKIYQRESPEVQGAKVLRLSVFADASLLQHLAQLNAQDPPSAAQAFIVTGVSAMENLLQEALEGNKTLKIVLVHMGVWSETAAQPVQRDGTAGVNLSSFCKWANKINSPRGTPGHWHHAMLLTGKELFTSTPETLGSTFVGGACHPFKSCSVVETNSFEAVHIAVHELAHSLGISHDGMGEASSCPLTGFIMGEALTETSFTWSNCSKNAFTRILKENKCLETETSKPVSVQRAPGEGDHFPSSLGIGDLLAARFPELDHTRFGSPGQIYPADAQCQLAFGSDYRAVPSSTNVCYYLMCSNGALTRGAHPALAGTPCGENLVCAGGTCSGSTNAAGVMPNPPFFPSSPQNCPTGGAATPKPPSIFSNLIPGGGIFPGFFVPREVMDIPMELRCTLLPPFLHASLGCSDSVHNDEETAVPTSGGSASEARRSSFPRDPPIHEDEYDSAPWGTNFEQTGNETTAPNNNREDVGASARLHIKIFPTTSNTADQSSLDKTSSEQATNEKSSEDKKNKSTEQDMSDSQEEGYIQNLYTASGASDKQGLSSLSITGNKRSNPNLLHIVSEDLTTTPIHRSEHSEQSEIGVYDPKVMSVPGKNIRQTMESSKEDVAKAGDERNENTLLAIKDFSLTGSEFQFRLPKSLLGLFSPSQQDQKINSDVNSYVSTNKQNLIGEVEAEKQNNMGIDEVEKQTISNQRSNDYRMSFLRSSVQQEPIKAITAPSYLRTSRTTECSKDCGFGTRTVSQVCVEGSNLRHEVSKHLCNGLPNSLPAFNETCNNFPCDTPKWVVGKWGLCSEYCDIGVQHRLVACALPLLHSGSPSAAALYLDPKKCEGTKPREARLCKGSCLPVDCDKPDNTFHQGCFHLLQDLDLEKDHRDQR